MGPEKVYRVSRPPGMPSHLPPDSQPQHTMLRGSRSNDTDEETMSQGSSFDNMPALGQPARPPWRAAMTSHSFAMLSDPGRVRHANEDSCGADAAHGAFAVCDGMGGAASGEVASTLACETFLGSLGQPGPSSRVRLAEAIRAANQAVYRQAQRSRAHRGMGTTLVGLLCGPSGTMWIAHAGDSRCYRMRAGQLERLTRDHSLIEEQVQAGVMTLEEAAVSPIRNIITRAVGSYPVVEPDIAEHSVESGDIFLLATDGLTRELTDEQIAAILRECCTHLPTEARERSSVLRGACETLVAGANEHGGRDNITVLLVAIR